MKLALQMYQLLHNTLVEWVPIIILIPWLMIQVDIDQQEVKQESCQDDFGDGFDESHGF
jgi:hypothetical protein